MAAMLALTSATANAAAWPICSKINRICRYMLSLNRTIDHRYATRHEEIQCVGQTPAQCLQAEPAVWPTRARERERERDQATVQGHRGGQSSPIHDDLHTSVVSVRSANGSHGFQLQACRIVQIKRIVSQLLLRCLDSLLWCGTTVASSWLLRKGATSTTSVPEAARVTSQQYARVNPRCLQLDLVCRTQTDR